MAKFNSPTTIKTTNKEGHVAYGMTDKAKLVTQVLTSFFNEKKFYYFAPRLRGAKLFDPEMTQT